VELALQLEGRARQKRLAFCSKGSIGVVVRRRDMMREPNRPFGFGRSVARPGDGARIVRDSRMSGKVGS
jgi:hypothetical protein